MTICDRCKKADEPIDRNVDIVLRGDFDGDGTLPAIESIGDFDFFEPCRQAIWQAVQAAIDKAMEGGSDATPN